MRYTIFGGHGFIGKALAKRLALEGHEVIIPTRSMDNLTSEDLGNVYYCIGLTADFRSRVFETVEAHVCQLTYILKKYNYDSFVYLSSTRVYKNCSHTSMSEDAELTVDPSDIDDLYNISKLMGESLCLAQPRASVKVVRLSNVVGPDFTSVNFFNTILLQALQENRIDLRTSVDSEKDYILLEDVVELLVRVPFGKNRLYNLCSGFNCTTKELLNEISTHVKFELNETGFAKFSFHEIANERVKDEFGFEPGSVLAEIRNIINTYQNENNC